MIKIIIVGAEKLAKKLKRKIETFTRSNTEIICASATSTIPEGYVISKPMDDIEYLFQAKLEAITETIQRLEEIIVRSSDFKDSWVPFPGFDVELYKYDPKKVHDMLAKFAPIGVKFVRFHRKCWMVLKDFRNIRFHF